jgi:agmatine deiminase
MYQEIKQTPASLGYRFPAEFEPHLSTWLSWPHKLASWPGKLEEIYPFYAQFVKYLALDEQVNINVNHEAMATMAKQHLQNAGVNIANVHFHLHPTNDAWCRDHGPAFLVNPNAEEKKIIVDWAYNAWGGKYPPYDLDDHIPTLVAQYKNIPVCYPEIIMEGGSVEFNGKGTLLTSKACLLNPNRNPHLNQSQIEKYLYDYYGVNNILWVNDGIIGDDTDGHIDDITRFVNQHTVLTAIEHNRNDENYPILKENLKLLEKMKLEDGKNLNIVEIPMPKPVVYDGQVLPASYANFYISNHHVIVPTYRDKNDELALDIIQSVFTSRKVVGIDSTDIIWGLGSFHCLSQQEPLV